VPRTERVVGEFLGALKQIWINCSPIQIFCVDCFRRAHVAFFVQRRGEIVEFFGSMLVGQDRRRPIPIRDKEGFDRKSRDSDQRGPSDARTSDFRCQPSTVIHPLPPSVKHRCPTRQVSISTVTRYCTNTRVDSGSKLAATSSSHRHVVAGEGKDIGREGNNETVDVCKVSFILVPSLSKPLHMRSSILTIRRSRLSDGIRLSYFTILTIRRS
jgi:hypothetical protein